MATTKALTVADLPNVLVDVAYSGDYADLTNTPVLADVATSGDYNDLINTPTLATVANSGSYNDLSDKPTIPTNLDSLTDVTVTSPTTDQVLKYNGSSWINGAAPAGGQYFGSAAVKAIAYNSNTIAENITITAGNNGLSAGPIEIATGYTVDIATGANWVIV